MRNHILNLYLNYSEKRRNENKIGNTFPYTIHWRERSGKFGLSVIFKKKQPFPGWKYYTACIFNDLKTKTKKNWGHKFEFILDFLLSTPGKNHINILICDVDSTHWIDQLPITIGKSKELGESVRRITVDLKLGRSLWAFSKQLQIPGSFFQTVLHK